MKIRSVAIAMLTFCLLNACNNNTKQEDAKTGEASKTDTVMEAQKPEEPYKNLAFDDKYDRVCGMPVTAGVTDTVHYKGKLLGFCSKECKEAFVKEPLVYLKDDKESGHKH